MQSMNETVIAPNKLSKCLHACCCGYKFSIIVNADIFVFLFFFVAKFMHLFTFVDEVHYVFIL